MAIFNGYVKLPEGYPFNRGNASGSPHFFGGPKTAHPEMTVKADHCHGSTSKLEPVDHGLDSVFVGRGIHRVVYISVYI